MPTVFQPGAFQPDTFSQYGGQQSSAIGFSSATTDGDDILAAAIGVSVDVTSATTDGADVLAAAVSPTVEFSSSTTDGADVLAAAVDVITALAFSSSTTDGEDALAAAILNPSGFDTHDYKPKKNDAARIRRLQDAIDRRQKIAAQFEEPEAESVAVAARVIEEIRVNGPSRESLEQISAHVEEMDRQIRALEDREREEADIFAIVSML